MRVQFVLYIREEEADYVAAPKELSVLPSVGDCIDVANKDDADTPGLELLWATVTERRLRLRDDLWIVYIEPADFFDAAERAAYSRSGFSFAPNQSIP